MTRNFFSLTALTLATLLAGSAAADDKRPHEFTDTLEISCTTGDGELWTEFEVVPVDQEREEAVDPDSQRVLDCIDEGGTWEECWEEFEATEEERRECRRAAVAKKLQCLAEAQTAYEGPDGNGWEYLTDESNCYEQFSIDLRACRQISKD